MIAAMARIDYEVVSRDYIAGRGLEEGGLAGWREAVAPYLRTLALPLADVGSGTGQFAPLFARWFGIDVIGVEDIVGHLPVGVSLGVIVATLGASVGASLLFSSKTSAAA